MPSLAGFSRHYEWLGSAVEHLHVGATRLKKDPEALCFKAGTIFIREFLSMTEVIYNFWVTVRPCFVSKEDVRLSVGVGRLKLVSRPY